MNGTLCGVLALLAAIALGLVACERDLFRQESPQTLSEVPSDEMPRLTDDSDPASLSRCIRQSLDQLGRIPADRIYQVDGQKISAAELRRTLTALDDGIRSSSASIDWNALISDRFRLLRAAPPSGFVFTGYYQPELPASRERTSRFRYPIYRVPDDLVRVDPGGHCTDCENVFIGRVQDHEIVPYYSRADIDGAGVLEGRDAELAWLDDPIEVFFLHVQGSGVLHFEDGTSMQIGFAGSNGRTYRSIGKLLVESGKVPLERASSQTLKQYLREHPDERDALLFTNERYVFFRPVPVGPIGSLGVPLTPGRSIAVDPGSYPLGGVAYIHTERRGESGPIQLTRFVCLQDAGAAINGPGRIDVFWGAGPDAERIAGPMRAGGEMYLLLAR